MPINIPGDLPAKQILNRENIFIMEETKAMRQDIRPLKIAILNLMPSKIETETQLLRLLGNTPLQIDVELLQTATHTPTHTPQEHLLKFYKVFDDVKDKRFDGLIITGAPIEHLEFGDVDYWPELCRVMEWSKTNVFSTLHICWGAQAALYYHYGVKKYPLPQKKFGVFSHERTDKAHYLLFGFDDNFFVPHSRHTEVRRAEIEGNEHLHVLSNSSQAGVYAVASDLHHQFFITGHSEYDADTLAREYFRDVDKGLPIQIPVNYFPDNNPDNVPPMRWKAHSNLLFANWLNYFVYQLTPYDFVRE